MLLICYCEFLVDKRHLALTCQAMVTTRVAAKKCKMHGFTDALRICKIINCGRFVLDYKFIFALGERAYSTLPYSEIITAVS